MKATRAKKFTLPLLAVSLASASALAASSGQITLQGNVAQATNIVVTGQGNYNALDLTTSASDLLVAKVREINNTSAGYTVKLTSTNAGKFKNGVLGQVAYTAKYNGSNVTLSATPQIITTQGTQSGVINVLKEFKISYTGQAAENLMAGTYSDTLTFTIASP